MLPLAQVLATLQNATLKVPQPVLVQVQPLVVCPARLGAPSVLVVKPWATLPSALLDRLLVTSTASSLNVPRSSKVLGLQR